MAKVELSLADVEAGPAAGVGGGGAGAAERAAGVGGGGAGAAERAAGVCGGGVAAEVAVGVVVGGDVTVAEVEEAMLVFFAAVVHGVGFFLLRVISLLAVAGVSSMMLVDDLSAAF